MRYLIFLVYLLLFSVGCKEKESDLTSGLSAYGFKMANLSERSDVLKKMEEESIPYKINERGFITYRLINQAAVLGIVRDVAHKGKIDRNYLESIDIANDEIMDRYIYEFNVNNIPYSTNEDFVNLNTSARMIFWSQSYGKKVDLIRQKINLQLAKESLSKAIDDGEVPERFRNSYLD